jgi:hypothetical protein
MSNLPIQFQDKVNSPELLAYLQQFGEKSYLSAEEINQIRDGINELAQDSFPDAVLQTGAITITGLAVSIAANAFAWRINQQEFLTPAAYNVNLTAAANGFYRADIIVGTSTGTYQVVQGNPSATTAIEPNTPEGTIRLAGVVVFGMVVGQPTPTPTTNYVQKSERANVVLTGSGVINQLDLVDEKATIVFKGSVTRLNTISYASVPYNGKRITLFNAQNTPVTIGNSVSGFGVDFVFPDGQDYVLKPNETIEFSFDITYAPYAHHMLIGAAQNGGGDYNAIDIVNDSGVPGANVKEALDYISNGIANEVTGVFANLQSLINTSPNGTTINLKPKAIYVQQDSLIVKEGIYINGNGATLKRGVEQVTTLTVSANQASTTITVASVPNNLYVGSRLTVYVDDKASTSSQPAVISNIVGNVITLKSALIHSNLSVYTWNIGAKVRKDYDQISTPYDSSENPITITYSVKNLTIDGDKSNNSSSFYWAVNSGVFNNGKSLFEKCIFINMPNECIMGGGMAIIDCYAQDLNGSFVHQSVDQTKGEGVLGGEISGNTVKNSNIKASPLITGHSEGVITFSFTSGRCSINNNRFLGGGQAVLGRIVNSENPIDGSIKDFIFTNNYCENYPKVVDDFTYNVTNLVTGPDKVYILDNIFSNCGVDDWSVYAISINAMGVIKFTGNLLTNGTVILNIPEKMKTGFLPAGGTENYLPKYDLNGYLVPSLISEDSNKVNFGKPIFKERSANGTNVLPIWDKNIFSGLFSTHECGIEFGNTITNNNGTMIRFFVNFLGSANTPIYPILLDSDGSTNINYFMNIKPGSAPISPKEGAVYFDITTKKLRCWNGTTWNDLF